MSRRVLLLGAGAAALSAAGTYTAILFAYPAVLVLGWLARRASRALHKPKPATARFGLALALAALAMPIAAVAGVRLYEALRQPTAWSSAAPAYVAYYAPAVAVLALALASAWIGPRSARTASHRDGGKPERLTDDP